MKYLKYRNCYYKLVGEPTTAGGEEYIEYTAVRVEVRLQSARDARAAKKVIEKEYGTSDPREKYAVRSSGVNLVVESFGHQAVLEMEVERVIKAANIPIVSIKSHHEYDPPDVDWDDFEIDWENYKE